MNDLAREFMPRYYMKVLVDIMDEGANICCWFGVEPFPEIDLINYPNERIITGDRAIWVIKSNHSLLGHASLAAIEYAEDSMRRAEKRNENRLVVNRGKNGKKQDN